MRLTPEKIQELAQVIYEGLATHPELTLAEDRDKVIALIRQVIHDDLAAEDALEDEARRLLSEHMDEIQRKGMSFDKLVQKTKQRLAMERKMVL